MILALPKQVDIDKFTAMLAMLLRGRYGENSYYGGGLYLTFQPILSMTLSEFLTFYGSIFGHGFSGKGSFRYYGKDAEELDPVIIAAIECLVQFIEGAGYSFVADKKILPQGWWKPYPQHCKMFDSDEELADIRDVYFEKLQLIDENVDVETKKAPQKKAQS